MKIHREDTAIVFIDPQNEVLSEKGLAWPLVRESLVRRISLARIARARFRSGRGERCDGRAKAPRVGLRL
jgi:hypothetical protein